MEYLNRERDFEAEGVRRLFDSIKKNHVRYEEDGFEIYITRNWLRYDTRKVALIPRTFASWVN